MRTQLVLSAGLLLALLPRPVSAQEGQWLAYDYADTAGQTNAQLQFGVAETEALVVSAACAPGAPQIAVALYIDTASIAAGDPATIRVAVGGRSESRPGAVVEDVFGTHAVTTLAPDDPLWERLAAGLAATLVVEGGAETAIHLRGSRAAITRFLASCAVLRASPPPQPVPDTAAAPAPDAEPAAAETAPDAEPTTDTAEPPAAPEAETTDTAEGADTTGADAAAVPLVPAAPPAQPPAPPYPLYVTGEEPVPAFSAMRFGIVLDPLPPGSTVRRTGSTGVREGHEWLEVQTVGPRVRTVWVRRDQLEPSAAGAAGYQNPSPAATLLIREAPQPDAAVVGAIPARAIGILDLGQRQGDWVMVSFEGAIGWVSHLYLLPVGPALPSAEPPAPPTAIVATAEPYSASHDAWTVDCDPCRAATDGPACSIASPSRATARRQAVLTLEPETDGATALQAHYASSADLAGPADAVMAVTVDLAPPQPLAAGDWRLDAVSGDALIASASLAALLPAARGGQLLTISVSDGARIWTDQFALAGFPAALDDLTARLPMPSRLGDPEVCPEPGAADSQTQPGAQTGTGTDAPSPADAPAAD
ncbi:MAG: hypothetical protein ACFCVH_02005 [Alphaproteobacteria bacterium]